MNKIVHSILLQGKFFLVEWLNISYSLIPNPLRKCYLRIFGIRLGGGHYDSSELQILPCWENEHWTEFNRQFRLLS